MGRILTNMEENDELKMIRQEVQDWGNSPQGALLAAIKEYRGKGSARPQSLTLRIQRGSGNPEVPHDLVAEFSFWVPGLVGTLLESIETYIKQGRSRPSLLVLTVKPGNRWRSSSGSQKKKEAVFSLYPNSQVMKEVERELTRLV